MKPVYYNNIEFQEILQKVKELVQQAEQSPSEETKALITSVMQYFDLMHREPLARLMHLIESSHPELKEKMKHDYTIKTLLSLYDFQP